jgi:hypothetical protein
MKTLTVVILTLVASVLCIPSGSPRTMPGVKPCGVDRWAVKTLSDPAAKKVNFVAQYTSVQSLISEKRPVAGKAALPNNRTSPLEYKTFKMRALVVGYKLESDRDFHVVLADPDDRGRTMVAEIPDPQCDGAKSSDHAAEYQAARSALIHLVGPPEQGQFKSGNSVPITITGVGFFDAVRGQIGGAPNGVELHPVLSIQ